MTTDNRTDRQPFYNFIGEKRPTGMATMAYIWANLPEDEFFADNIADILANEYKCLKYSSNCSNYAKHLVTLGLAEVIGRQHRHTILGKKQLIYRKVSDPAFLSPEIQHMAKSADSRLELYSMLGWL